MGRGSWRWSWSSLLVPVPMVAVAAVWAGLLVIGNGDRGAVEGLAANMAPVPRDFFPEDKPAEIASSCPSTLGEDVLAGSPGAETLIVVWKSRYQLGFYRDGKIASTGKSEEIGTEGRDIPACFDVALGFEPEGAKTTQGDGKTPEGWYWMSWKIPHGQTSFYKALYVNYPNAEDAALALGEGRIDQATHDRIASAASKHSTVTDSPLGGLIEIHGSGNSPRNWTLGCVALDNSDMDWLYDAAVSGKTAIRILP